jgi:ADP-heptose:LPS heptosyltransferase
MEKLKPIEHKFKALFFRLFEKSLKRGSADFRPLDGSQMKKVLFLRPEKIGDMVISLPVFDGLIQFYPHIKISILGSPKNFPLIKNDPRFERIYLYSKSALRDLPEFYRIRKERYDCVVDMICDDSVTALFLSQFLAPGKPRIGVGKKKFREFYDFNFDHRLGNTGHIIENTLKLLEAFGIDSARVSPYAPPYLGNGSRAKAEAFFSTFHDTLKVGINLSAGSPTRVWEEANYQTLTNRISTVKPESQIILFTIPSERNRAMRIAQSVESDVKIIPENLGLTDVCAMISKLDVLISPDTSLVHIARALQVPVVGLYTRFMKNYLLWRPYGQEIGSVISGNDDNIHDITVDSVLETLLKVTDSHKRVKS